LVLFIIAGRAPFRYAASGSSSLSLEPVMKYLAITLLFSALLFSVGTGADQKAPVTNQPAQPANPQIDMKGYLQVSLLAAQHRETRRISEEDFIRMGGEKGTIILDARSKEKYDLLHVKGAINLSFPDITIDGLKDLIPDKSTRILIYCNNNFRVPEGLPCAGRTAGATATSQRQGPQRRACLPLENADRVVEYLDLHRPV
jgi:hypothetical protein